MWITTYLNKEGKNGVDGYIRPKTTPCNGRMNREKVERSVTANPNREKRV
jgi:hypothetical protein